MGAVVGVDPSIASTGVVALGEVNVFQRVASKAGADDLHSRLERMRSQCIRTVEAARDFAPWGEVDLIVIEGPAYGKNNAMTHMLAGYWWLLVHGLEKVAPIAVVAPGTAKKFATGNGAAGKDEMLAAAIGAFGSAAGIKSNDVADAAALAAMGAVHLGREYGGAYASAGRASVQAVRWPELRSK